MKISVHIEADSAEEFHAAIAALSGASTPPAEPDVVPAKAPVEESRFQVEPPVGAEEPAPTYVAATLEKPKRGPKKAGNGVKKAPVEAAPVEPEPAPVEPEPAPSVRQDLLDAAQGYVLSYGYNFASRDIPELFAKHFGPDVRKVSEVPDKLLGAAIQLVRQALADNPYNRRVTQDAA